jgi:hypothetical protein
MRTAETQDTNDSRLRLSLLTGLFSAPMKEVKPAPRHPKAKILFVVLRARLIDQQFCRQITRQIYRFVE